MSNPAAKSIMRYFPDSGKLGIQDLRWPTPAGGRLLTLDEVCAKLGGVRPWTIRSWVSQRRIPYTKVGG